MQSYDKKPYLCALIKENVMKSVVLCCLSGALAITACQSGGMRHEARQNILAADSDFFESTELVLSGEAGHEPPSRMDEVFDDFFFNFAGSERLQRSRINFPLHLNAFGNDMAIEKDEWTYESFFHNDDFYTVFFNDDDDIDLAFANHTAINVQLINAADSTMQTYHFDRQDGQWKLTRQVMSELTGQPMDDFYYFYARFASDSLMQRRSLKRPLRFVTSDTEDEGGSIEGTLTPDQWFVFHPDLPQGVLTNILYGQQYTNPSQMIMCKRGIANGMLDIFTFNRRDGEWKLTKYEN